MVFVMRPLKARLFGGLGNLQRAYYVDFRLNLVILEPSRRNRLVAVLVSSVEYLELLSLQVWNFLVTASFSICGHCLIVE